MTVQGRKAVIAGVYATEQGPHADRSGYALQREALLGAVADAGLTLADVDGLANIRSDTKSASVAVPGIWAELLDHPLTYHEMVDVAAASHCASLAHVAAHVEAGLCDTVVVLAGWHRGSPKDIVREMAYMHGEFDTSWGSLAASWFAMIARRYLSESGTTMDQLAHVAVAAREWAALHPLAMRREPLSLDDVRESPPIAEPLRLLDCCQTNNGAGAVVITTMERADASGHRPVLVAGGGESYVGRGYTDVNRSYEARGAARSAARALAHADVPVREIDIFGLYDPYTFMPLMLLEEIGYCESGEAGALAENGAFRPGGSVALNIHGGALSWGNSINSLAHAIEAILQLQGRAGARQLSDPQTALIHGMGGTLNLHSTVVLVSS